MITVRIRRIGVRSAFRMGLAVHVGLGVLTLLLAGLGVSMPFSPYFIPISGWYPLSLVAGIAVQGLIGAAIWAAVAFLYNAAASGGGGIELEMQRIRSWDAEIRRAEEQGGERQARVG